VLCRRRHNTHLIRASLRYASYTDRKKLATALRPIYTAVNADAAEQARAAAGFHELGGECCPADPVVPPAPHMPQHETANAR
jgi:transposase-like protein